jgi:hypothetical protein
MATYVNDLRLKEIATGDESGTWGTSTNTNLELIAEAFSYGTEVITTNADTHTTTIADGASDPGRALYLKYTGTLDSACTITIGPNTVSKVWIIENGTSGSQDIILSQGSGANITIPAGDTKVVYSDGAGAGAAFFDAFANLKVTDPAQTNITSVGTLTGLTTTGDINFGDDDKAVFGAGSDLEIYHDGSYSWIKDVGTGSLIVAATDLSLQNAAATKAYANFNDGGSSTIHYDGSAKLATTATGIDVTGTATMDGLTVEGSSTGTLNVVNFLNTNNSANQTANRLGLGISNTSGANYTYIEAKETGVDAFAEMNFYTGTTATKRMTLGTYGDISFYDDTGTSQALFWDASAESLGIGTTSPNQKLNVSGGRSYFGANNEAYAIGVGYNGTRTAANQTYFIGATDATTPDLQFSNSDGGEKVRITHAGNVGIGASSPQAKLHLLDTDDVYLQWTDSGNIAGRIGVNGSYMHFGLDGADGETERMRIDSSGNLLAGTTSSAQDANNGTKILAGGNVSVVNSGANDGFDYYNSSVGAYRFYVQASGQIAATFTSISAISDIRFKENVRDLDVGLNAIMSLKPRLYDWKEGKGANIKNARGFIAQEFEEVFPDLIDEWKDPAPEGEEPYKSVRQDLIPVLVKAIQEQQTLIESLTARITALES